MGHVKQTMEQRPMAMIRNRLQDARIEPPQATRGDELRHRVEHMVIARQYDKMLDMLKSVWRDRQLLNAKGVCLLRLGRVEEAGRLYYDLVLNPGCTWMRPDLPTLYKTNYATALLLSGHPSGCLEMLAEIKDEQNPTVQRLRAAIKNWESRLTFLQKLNWWFGHIEPANRPVTIDFEAGEFEQVQGADDTPSHVSSLHSPNVA